MEPLEEACTYRRGGDDAPVLAPTTHVPEEVWNFAAKSEYRDALTTVRYVPNVVGTPRKLFVYLVHTRKRWVAGLTAIETYGDARLFGEEAHDCSAPTLLQQLSASAFACIAGARLAVAGPTSHCV